MTNLMIVALSIWIGFNAGFAAGVAWCGLKPEQTTREPASKGN